MSIYYFSVFLYSVIGTSKTHDDADDETFTIFEYFFTIFHMQNILNKKWDRMVGFPKTNLQKPVNTT